MSRDSEVGGDAYVLRYTAHTLHVAQHNIYISFRYAVEAGSTIKSTRYEVYVSSWQCPAQCVEVSLGF